ncbi:MAG: hypothetical protein JST16_16225 [Bdellovibrionales bacterium]|nr:hypothetical protein [Bdellovibrionales bacterium]
MRRSQLLVVSALCFFTAPAAQAAQGGPVFPTHHYPSDESFHLGYRLSYFTTGSNFVGPSTYKSLEDKSTYSVVKHSLLGEYQPSRKLSVGAIFNLNSAALNPATGTGVSDSGFGDQYLFAEYRFFDEPGSSLGVAFVPKFPGYKNPTIAELVAANKNRVALLGDAQVDFTTLMTSEFWPSNSVRIRADFGYTMKTESLPSEIPFLFAGAYVNPKVDLEFRVRGNFSMGGTDPTADADTATIKSGMAGSDYVYANAPWTVVMQPAIEFWVSPSMGLTADYSYAVMGNHSPHYQEMAIGLMFREAKIVKKSKRTFREVDIGTDQEAGQFQGETNNAPAAPQGTPTESPRDEEFR